MNIQFKTYEGSQISDADVSGEYKAMAILAEHYPKFVSAMQDAIALTDVRKAHLEDALATLRDEMPDLMAWREAISDARRGY